MPHTACYIPRGTLLYSTAVRAVSLVCLAVLGLTMAKVGCGTKFCVAMRLHELLAFLVPESEKPQWGAMGADVAGVCEEDIPHLPMPLPLPD